VYLFYSSRTKWDSALLDKLETLLAGPSLDQPAVLNEVLIRHEVARPGLRQDLIKKGVSNIPYRQALPSPAEG
jgi:hypothetical protein